MFGFVVLCVLQHVDCFMCRCVCCVLVVFVVRCASLSDVCCLILLCVACCCWLCVAVCCWFAAVCWLLFAVCCSLCVVCCVLSFIVRCSLCVDEWFVVACLLFPFFGDVLFLCVVAC